MSKNGFSLLPQLVHCTTLIIHLGHTSTTHHLATSPPLAHLCAWLLPSSYQTPINIPPTLNSAHAHASITDPSHSTHHHPAPVHSPRPPITSPWGCYVHSQNGWGGLCPSSLAGCHCMHSYCSMVVKCTLSPAKQACTYFHPLLSP